MKPTQKTQNMNNKPAIKTPQGTQKPVDRNLHGGLNKGDLRNKGTTGAGTNLGGGSFNPNQQKQPWERDKDKNK